LVALNTSYPLKNTIHWTNGSDDGSLRKQQRDLLKIGVHILKPVVPRQAAEAVSKFSVADFFAKIIFCSF
jgi:hypothetical protein